MRIGGAVGALIRNTRLFELACYGNINVRTRTPTKRGNPTLLGQPSSHVATDCGKAVKWLSLEFSQEFPELFL